MVKGTDLGNMNQLEAINPYVVLQVGDEAKETTIKTVSPPPPFFTSKGEDRARTTEWKDRSSTPDANR